MYAVIRVRGTIGINQDIKDTLKSLNLTRPNHCILLDEKKGNEGMLQKAQNYITWGEVNTKGLKHLLKRAEFKEKTLKEHLKEYELDSTEELAKKIKNKEIKLKNLNLKPVIRLHPPRKGYESTKRAYKERGSLGYRGEDINKLIYRMR